MGPDSQGATGPGGAATMEGFDGTIEPRRPGPLYLMGLLIVAVAMVLLPLVYISLIGLVAYGLYYHATKHLGLLESPLGWLAYAAPLIAGGVVVLFLVTPLITLLVRIDMRHPLEPAQAPRLYAFVGTIATCVGAPEPRTIAVSLLPNAGALLAGGPLGLIRGRLTLVIGLPLVAGMTTRQLACVIAHELGHFSQCAGMRLTRVVRFINAWFAFVVRHRDAWDEALAAGFGEARDFGAVVGFVARLGVWMSSSVLWVLMWTGRIVAWMMLRQMEYDADRCAIRFAGSDAFASMMHRLRQLADGAALAARELAEPGAENRLPDDLPELIAARADQPPESGKPAARPPEARRGILATHPSQERRLARAKNENAPGVYRVEVPAAQLVDDFSGLCRRVTLDYYRHRFGRVRLKSLVPLHKVVAQHQLIEAAEAARQRYFQGLLNPWRPWVVAKALEDIPLTGAEAPAELARLRRELLDRAERGREACDMYVRALDDLSHTRQVSMLLDAGFPVDLAALGLPAPDRSGLDAARRQAEQALAQAERTLQPIDLMILARLRLALGLLRAAAPDSPERKQNLAGRVRRHLKGLRVWHTIAPKLHQLIDRSGMLGGLLGECRCAADDGPGLERERRCAGELHRFLSDLHALLQDADYPLEHTGGDLSIASFAIGTLPDPGDLTELHEKARACLDNLLELYLGLMGRLALVAERMETACGMPPLPEPVLGEPCQSG